MLSDVLGVLIAFVSIILLLSIVVTGLAQATQAVFRLRGRNLLTSVTRLLEATNHVTAGAPRAEKRKQAARVLNSGNVAAVDKVAKPDGLLRRVILGPKTSWVEARELAAAIKNTDAPQAIAGAAAPAPEPAPPATTNKDMPPPAPPEDPLVKAIKRAEPTWCKRFQYFMRLITIAWSLIIAVGFQVSAPALFASLSQDPARTALILGEQQAVTKLAEQAIAEDEYDLVSDDALEKLAKQYPAFADDIAQAGNAAPTKSELVQQLVDVMPDVPQRPEVVQAYSKLIDDFVKNDDTSSTDTTAAAVDKLAAFGISWWQYDMAFYRDANGAWNVSIIIGVLITAILLTFGAPFWFEQLRTLAALRDPRAAAAEKRRTKEERELKAGDEEFTLVRRAPRRDG
jgi:hypothetical protein